MEIRNGFSVRTAIRFGWYLAALGCLSLSAHAQSDFGDKIWWKADADSFVPDYNKSAAFPAKATPLGGALVINGAGIVHGPAEWPKASARSGIPGLNKSAPIDVVARFKPASVGAAFGRLASKVGPVGSIVALATFAAEIGVILTDNPGGAPGMTMTDPAACTASPCYSWSWNGLPGVTHSSPEAMCGAIASKNNLVFRRFAPYSCYFGKVGDPETSVSISRLTVAPQPAGQIPATSTDLENLVAAKSGWPTSSTIGPAIVEALKNGQTIETEAPTVSGPASNTVGKTVTNNPNGSVTTTTTNNNYTYNGPKVTVTTTTVTSNFNPATGVTDTTTSTAYNVPETTPPAEEEGACDLYPNALGCAELDTPSEEIPRDTKTISYGEENVFGSGSCPANLTASIATLGRSFTVWDWSKTCELALPLRALVLGLASFAALLIVMPGGNKT